MTGCCSHAKFSRYGQLIQILVEHDGNSTTRNIPIRSIVSYSHIYDRDDKVDTIVLLLQEKMSYNYSFKCKGEVEKALETLRDAFL
jgi:hypothetical protein